MVDVAQRLAKGYEVAPIGGEAVVLETDGSLSVIGTRDGRPPSRLATVPLPHQAAPPGN